jgi:hypothetical protein
MNNKKIILPTKRFANADEEDIDVRLNLDEQRNLLREGDRNIVLDIAELFNKERNESKNYKIHGKIKMVFRNLYSGTTSYSPLRKELYLNGDGFDNDFSGYLPYNEFAFLRHDVVREVYTGFTGTDLTDDIDSSSFVLTGYTGHTTLTPIHAPYHNWNIYLSYVYSGDTNHSMIYTLSGATKTQGINIITFKSGDGIPFRVTTGTTYITLTSPVEHGISKGEYLLLSGKTEVLYITDVGNETYNSEKYVLNILKNDIPTGITFTNNTLVVGKRCIDKNNITGTTSQYYVHKHKILTSSKDYIMDKIGFESPIWEEEKKLLYKNSSNEEDYLVQGNRMESVVYDFKEPFVLTGLTNNLGYTPTDLYVTIFLRNGNGYFDYPPKVGWKFNFHNDWIDYQFSGTTTGNTDSSFGTGTTFTSNSGTAGFISGNTLSVGVSGITGAFIEYNVSELKERTISEAYHKFTSPTTIFDYGQTTSLNLQGAGVNNKMGLIYQPFYGVKIRQLSPYIETSNTNEILNLPENVKYFENEGLWKWRDLYDQGFIDQDGYGTSYPFINNIHYIKNDINFYIRNERFYTNKSDGIKKFKDSKIC